MLQNVGKYYYIKGFLIVKKLLGQRAAEHIYAARFSKLRARFIWFNAINLIAFTSSHDAGHRSSSATDVKYTYVAWQKRS